jgi:hypothetical protein
VVFAAGIGISLDALELRWRHVSVGPVLLILGLLGPLALAVSSLSLQLSARAVGRRIGFRDGVAISAIGSVAELLPLPGGAMVRGAALMRAGAGLGESTWIVMLTALLTLSMAAALASVPLLGAGSAVGYLLLAGGLGGTLAAAGWIGRRAGAAVVLAMLAVRLGLLAVGVAQLSAAFAAIGLAVAPIDAAVFVVASSLGATVAIVPAGLGVSETIAAALALLVEIPAPAAFLAVALTRVLGLCASGAIALALVWMPARRGTGKP